MPGGRLLGIDLDPDAREYALRRLQPYAGAAAIVAGSYTQMLELAAARGLDGPDGILMDLGLSSAQLEGSGRGFSFLRDEPLDMRFDPESGPTAAEIVNTYSYEDLAQLLYEYGEEPRARAIARAIVASRPLGGTAELAALVSGVRARARGRRGGRIHPATRVFQALRLAVNSELEGIAEGLRQAVGLVRPGGRIAVIAYHSLEDRIVKNTFLRESRACVCPPGAPVCSCEHVPSLRVVTRKVVTPSWQEVTENPRSRSARLRVAQRL